MALSANKRQALSIARELIESGEEDYICLALREASRRNPSLNEAVKGLRKFISRQLFPYTFLHTWQMRNGFGWRPDRARGDRIAWIDWMLDETKEA
jgi:hypothetical protein